MQSAYKLWVKTSVYPAFIAYVVVAELYVKVGPVKPVSTREAEQSSGFWVKDKPSLEKDIKGKAIGYTSHIKQ